MVEEIEHLIIGAGLSGLMMGALLKRNFKIIDGAPGPRLDVHAPFYLHAPLEWLPTTWKQVDVHHNVWDGNGFHRAPTIRMMNDYSRKITGKIIDTSLKFMDGSVKSGYIPSNNLPGQVLNDLYDEVKANSSWGVKVIGIDPKRREVTAEVMGHAVGEVHQYRYKNLISTIPLPLLLSLTSRAFDCNFRSDPIFTSVWSIPETEATDAFQIIYITDPAEPIYRASLMGRSIILESMRDLSGTVNHQGIIINKLWGIKDGNFKAQGEIRPGKFHPIEKTFRKVMIGKLTSETGIFCLGRYAVWDYKRIDHVSEDAHTILKIIKGN